MPASIQLQRTYGDDLSVLFVESQGVSTETAARFAMKRRWWGGRAMWTSEAPVDMPSRYLPSFVLISSEGVPLLSGNPLTHKKKLVRAIDRELARTRDPARTDPAAQLALDLARVERWLDAGHPLEARALLEELGVEYEQRARAAAQAAPAAEASPEASPELEQLRALAARFARADMVSELRAARDLAEIEAAIASSGPAGALADLRALVEASGDTRVGARARELLVLAAP